MDKALYFVACVYQELKNRRPDGSPYFNLRVGLVFILFLHYAELAAIGKKRGVLLFPDSKAMFIAGLLLISTLVYYYIGIIFPLDQIKEIELNERDVKRNYFLLLSYMCLNIVLMCYLMFLLIPG